MKKQGVLWLLPRPVFVNKAIALRCVRVHCIAAHACTHTHSSLTAISQANPVDSLPSPLDFFTQNIPILCFLLEQSRTLYSPVRSSSDDHSLITSTSVVVQRFIIWCRRQL